MIVVHLIYSSDPARYPSPVQLVVPAQGISGCQGRQYKRRVVGTTDITKVTCKRCLAGKSVQRRLESAQPTEGK
jgi:hypothetical protein